MWSSLDMFYNSGWLNPIKDQADNLEISLSEYHLLEDIYPKSVPN